MTGGDDEGASARRFAGDGIAKAREAYELYAEAGERAFNTFEASAAQTMAAMRAFAGSARDAKQRLSGGHVAGAGELGYDAFEEAASRNWAGMREIAHRMLIASDTNVRSAFDHAERLARATDASEFAALQMSFLQEQVQRVAQQMIDLQRTATRVARDAASTEWERQ